MENKDRYLLLEVCLTFLLLFLVIFLLGEILSSYRVYVIFALAFAFCFSWFIRDKYSKEIKLFVTVAAFAVLGGMVYATLNSSLLYKDVIVICIKGALVLEIIISLNACQPPFLTYVQALSIPLFMSCPVFIKDNYNDTSLILTIAYIISWLAIFKVKFYEWFSPFGEKNIKRYISISISGVFFLIILISSWMIFSKFPLGEFRKGGVLPEEGPGEERGLEDEYYGWQDRLQEKITRLVPKLNSNEDKHEVLYLLSSLIKESPYVTEVEKAELGLISQIKEPGPGIEDKDTSSSLKTYVDKKILLNLKRDKDKIIDTLKKNPLDIKNRISILSRLNRMQYSNSYEKVSGNENELKKNINASSLPANAKRDAKESARRLKAWKAFEIYRRKLSSLNKGIDALEGSLKKQFADLSLQAKGLDRPSDYKELNKKLKDLKEGAAGQSKELIKELEEASDVKLEMSLAAKNMRLKEKLRDSNLSEKKITELKENADNITDAKDYQTLAKNSNVLKEISEEGQADASRELQELLENKTYSLLKESKNKIEDILKESALAEAQKKEFLSELERLESVKNSARLTSDVKKIEAAIEKLLNQGLISKETRDNLIKETGQLKGLLLLQLQAQDKELNKQKEQADSQKKWEELIEELPLKEETRERLRKLTEELSGADTVSKLENIKQAVEKTIESLSQDQTAELKDLLSSQAKLKEEELSQQKEQSDSQKKWEELIDKLALDEQASQELKQLAEELSQADTLSELEKINQQAEKQISSLYRQGVKKDQTAELKDLLSAQAKLKEEELSKQKEQADNQKKWEELIDKLALEEQASQELKQLAEELSQADTLSELEKIKQQAEKKLTALSKTVLTKERMKEQAERAKETFKQLFDLKKIRTIDKSLSNLNKNIEKLKEMDPQVNRTVEEHLRMLRNSSTEQEFQKRLDILKEYIDSQVSKTQEAPEEHRELNPWQIYIMPGRLVVPFDSFVSLKAVAIYNKIFIKELGPELEWLSSEPNVARVDEKGVVHSLSKGSAKISVRYRGKTIEGSEVIVVDKIAEGVDNEIKDYLLR